MPWTNQHLLPENAFTQRFWGRLDIRHGAAMYNFVKEGKVQNLVHALKYRQRVDIGQVLGREFGNSLRESSFFHGIDCVVPVPLHRRKERGRGYNQSVYWGEGIASGLGVPVLRRALVRKRFTTTQTHKTRAERVENVQRAFGLAKPKSLEGRHVLLVDDVLTTGATLEACGNLILGIQGSRLSLATLAMARM